MNDSYIPDIDDLAEEALFVAFEDVACDDCDCYPCHCDFEPGDIDGGELSFDPYAGCAIFGEDDYSDFGGFDF